MRFSLLSLLLVAIVSCASIVATPAQDRSEGDVQQGARQRYDNISFAGGDFEISDPALVPRQLVLAVEQSGCQYKTDIKELPIQFNRAENRRFALVYCSAIVGSHHVFDFADLRRPRLLELPFIAQKNGFGTTIKPGLITWKKDAGVFEAETGSDMCPNSELRHTYRLGTSGGLVSRTASFVVVRVEVREKPCGRNNSEWTTVWEAPPWPNSIIIR
ncbi:hypothetical protein [Bradyrhizobium paxllaeri]|uniref:hypothetical protein n=1 Tax=Bradyrhizobium paxllaeri TaxID=190148 RepID=UPI0008104549|nr:hypothetical protein [Bradyrhizobium paxllaeri]